MTGAQWIMRAPCEAEYSRRREHVWTDTSPRSPMVEAPSLSLGQWEFESLRGQKFRHPALVRQLAERLSSKGSGCEFESRSGQAFDLILRGVTAASLIVNQLDLVRIQAEELLSKWGCGVVV